MIALIIGLVAIAFAVLAMVPAGLNWWQDVLLFLRGSVPVFAVLVGLLAVLIGVADIKDQMEAKKEEAAEQAKEQQEKKSE
ncbi:MAG: hypothetical protein SNJ56_02310 [Termitinemataceae bacterium]